MVSNSLGRLQSIMVIKAWSFLVSRNRTLDYRTVVAPDFVCEAKISSLLARVAEGQLTNPGQGFKRKVVGSKVGNFTIVFRVIKAVERDINLTGDYILKDQFGREIYIFEGIVVKGNIENFDISEQDFQEVHQQLTASYENFWGLVDPVPAFPSHPFSLNTEKVNSSIALEELELFDLTEPLIPTPVSAKPIKKAKATKMPPKLLLALIFLIVVIGLIFGNALFGRAASLGCANTLEKKIEFETGNNVSDQLEGLKKKYPGKTSMYLSGFLIIESTKDMKNKEVSIGSEKQPTIKPFEDNRLDLSFHPIDLAINDLRNQKISGKGTITLRLIDRSECR